MQDFKGDESPRQALGRFLRERREAVAPDRVGISSRRGRRTPGLRREEVAFLADIGVKWYARLESGDDINPSEATLTGIAVALQLSVPELEYMLELAGLRQPLLPTLANNVVPQPVPAYLANVRGVAATFGDRILTPLHWNALADTLYEHSRFVDPVERNFLVRSLFDRAFCAFLGVERERLVSRAVGRLRLNASSSQPSPFVSAVFDRVKDHALFQKAWSARVIAAESIDESARTRCHPVEGQLVVYVIEYMIPTRPDAIVRTLVPADSETAAKFRRLENLAAQQVPSDARHLTACG